MMSGHYREMPARAWPSLEGQVVLACACRHSQPTPSGAVHALTRVDAMAVLWPEQLAQRLAGGDDGGFAARDLLEVHLKPAHPTGPWRLHAAR